MLGGNDPPSRVTKVIDGFQKEHHEEFIKVLNNKRYFESARKEITPVEVLAIMNESMVVVTGKINNQSMFAQVI